PDIFDKSIPYVRNAGIFWEAGAFAVYLSITLYLHYSEKKIAKAKDLFDIKSIVFILALISTTSTMGFIALILIMSLFSFQLKTVFKHVLFWSLVLSS